MNLDPDLSKELARPPLKLLDRDDANLFLLTLLCKERFLLWLLLAELHPFIPGNLPVPVALVQHMPPFFTKLLATQLDEKCKLTVKEGEAGPKIKPGTIWIAPNSHMLVKKNRTGPVTMNLNQGPLENSCRPAVNTLF